MISFPCVIAPSRCPRRIPCIENPRLVIEMKIGDFKRRETWQAQKYSRHSMRSLHNALAIACFALTENIANNKRLNI
jgi:hypothetical protein